MKHILTLSLCFLALSLSAYGQTDVPGCTISVACNYDPAATVNDGSCDFLTCLCLDGTVWSDELYGCVVENPTDTNLDGCTDLNDLMDILAAYGDCGTFTCGNLIEHEGYSYSTVQIGDQCWFAENCRYLPEVSPSSEGSETEPYYYVYGYEGNDVGEAIATANYETYGVLYNWPAAITEGICPTGWHIPSDGEWTQLTDFLGGESVAGGKMKEAGYEHWNAPNTGANNSCEFTAIPEGYRHVSGYYEHVNNYGYFWSSSAQGTCCAWYRVLYYNTSSVGKSASDQQDGMSVRCIKD